jgi:hypothetical protein
MTALRTTQMPDLSAELRGIDTGYRAAKPCMLALLDRIAHINETVVALPDKIAVGANIALSLGKVSVQQNLQSSSRGLSIL